MKIAEVFGRTDWTALAKQKMALLKAVSGTYDPEMHLIGLLHWLDAVRAAAEEDGFAVVWLPDLESKPFQPEDED